jgi:hypothetical protein
MAISLCKRFSLACILLCLFHFGLAQSQKNTPYFRSPIDYPISLSGNFGELRSNHFHSGIDIKTNGEEGKAIYAVADGYVSRIKVSPFGYGNALYITHSNGTVSLYGHLKSYNKKIEQYLRKEQYKQESFEVDLFLNKETLPVTQGDTIALSGNSGGSEGPHLHFEIRDEKTEHTLNPLLHGFSVPDSSKPEVYQVAIYPRDINASVNGSNAKKIIPIKVERGNLSMMETKQIEVSGKIGFSIETFDEENDHAGKNGTYSIQLFVDDVLQYEYKIKEFAFDQTRNINAHIDYAQKKKTGTLFQKCFVEPNNKFPNYKTSKDHGVYHFKDDSIHLIKIVVADVVGNENTLLFVVQSKSYVSSPDPKLPKHAKDLFYYNVENSFKDEAVAVHIPKGALQNDIRFEYNTEENPKYYSKIYKIHREDEGLLAAYTLKIKPEKWLPERLKSKLTIACVSPNGLSAEGGTYNEATKMVEAQLKNFGYFTLVLDTIKPKVNSIIIDKPEATVRNIIVKATDSFSGIKSYRGELDGKWILMEYDYKSNSFVYTFDEQFNPNLSEHLFKMHITDYKGNVRDVEKKF